VNCPLRQYLATKIPHTKLQYGLFIPRCKIDFYLKKELSNKKTKNKDSMESLTELVQRDQRRIPFSEGKSLLHMACENHSDIQDLAIPTVDLLLRVGADPNAGYRYGNGFFHAMVNASKECNIDASIQESVARLLLDASAHLHRVNGDRTTAADPWKNPNTASGITRL